MKDCKPFVLRKIVIAIVAEIMIIAHNVTKTLPRTSPLSLVLLDLINLSLTGSDDFSIIFEAPLIYVIMGQPPTWHLPLTYFVYF
jgi:hypothetical protein